MPCNQQPDKESVAGLRICNQRPTGPRSTKSSCTERRSEDAISSKGISAMLVRYLPLGTPTLIALAALGCNGSCVSFQSGGNNDERLASNTQPYAPVNSCLRSKMTCSRQSNLAYRRQSASQPTQVCYIAFSRIVGSSIGISTGR